MMNSSATCYTLLWLRHIPAERREELQLTTQPACSMGPLPVNLPDSPSIISRYFKKAVIPSEHRRILKLYMCFHTTSSGTFQGKSFVHSHAPCKKVRTCKEDVQALCVTELLAASCSWHSIRAHQAFVSCKPEAACSNCNTEAHA